MIFVQDMRTRTVHWLLFPFTGLLLLLLRWQAAGLWSQVWPPVFINICFVTLQLTLLSLYFSARNKRWINITQSMLGLGDILFLFVLTFYLSVFNFIAFYLVSLPVVLLLWLFVRKLSRTNAAQIPLAGFQSLLFIVFLASDWWVFHLKVTDDQWLIQILNRWL
ncbi:MAG TPA: hypothetical protein VIM77_07650 [Mucilaginibacter sp.]